MTARRGRVRIGTSGYVYGDWRGRFYPPTVPAGAWLPYYASRFPTVELNSPFYRLPTAAVFRAWRDQVPRRFVFAVKASRYLSHVKRLSDPAPALRLFLSRARELGTRLGPILVQLPRVFHANVDRLDGLLAALRRQRQVTGLRVAVEVRHESWLVPAVFERLHAANIALCFADWRELPVTEPVTADFVYVRRHGFGTSGSYPVGRLRDDADALRRWRDGGRDVFVYFNNDWRAFAVRNAARLATLLRA